MDIAKANNNEKQYFGYATKAATVVNRLGSIRFDSPAKLLQEVLSSLTASQQSRSMKRNKRYHRITLSALAKTVGGTLNPICLAVLRLMTSSNFVGCSTGRSAGFAASRILSTNTATRL